MEKHKYIVIGASGHTGRVVAEVLLEAGKSVTVVSRNAENVKQLTNAGAQVAVGSLEDVSFLTGVFEGATGIYAMIPPNFAAPDIRLYYNEISANINNALKAAGVYKNIVVLSSIGANTPESGIVAGLYDWEQRFLKEAHEGLDVLFLRAAFFMHNLFGNIGMIKNDFFGGAIAGGIPMQFAHTNDIGVVAARRLIANDFRGISHTFIAGNREYSFDEAAKILGKAIGKPDLRYTTLPYEQALAGMKQAGFPPAVANGMVQLARSINEGLTIDDYERTPEYTTSTTLETFAEHEFAPAFNAA